MSSPSIASLREQLNISWQGGHSQAEPILDDKMDAVELMSRNLSEQLGYSNSLLQDVNALEENYATAQQHIIAQDNEIFELRELLNTSQNAIAELQYKIDHLEMEKKDAQEAGSNLAKQNNDLAAKNEDRANEIELLMDRIKQHAEIQLNLSKQIADLEAEVQSLKHKEQESNRAGSSLNSKLKFENNALLGEIEEQKVLYQTLHENFILVRDENISMKKSLERYHRLNSEESTAKDELSRRAKDITSQNVEMSNDLQEALQINLTLEQEIALLRHTLEETKHHLQTQMDKYDTQNNSHKLLNDKCIQLDLQLQEAYSEINALQQYSRDMKQSLSDQLEKRMELDKVLQGKLDAELKFDKERIQELTSLLNLSSQKLKEDRLAYDRTIEHMTKQMNEAQASIELQRKEHEKLLNNAIKSRDDALEQVNNFMLVNKQNELLIATYGQEELDRRKELLAEIKVLKDTIHDNANHFVVSLNAIQQVVRKLCSETMAERNRLRLLATQHMKLGNILSELTGKQNKGKKIGGSVLEDSFSSDKDSVPPSPGGADALNKSVDNGIQLDRPHTVPPSLQGLVQYGDVISQVLTCFIRKQQTMVKENEKLRHALEDAEIKGKESVIKIQQCTRAQDSAMEQVIAHKKTILTLESKINEINHHNKLLTNTLLEDKKAHTEHITKLEVQISEQASHNIKLQNDLTRITSDCNHMQAQENLKNSTLTERIKHLETENAAMKEANKKLDIKNAELQTSYMECETKMIKLQSDFQTLRKNSLLISEQAMENQKKYSKNIESLNANVTQYRNQIMSLQQVNKTLSTYRNSLLEEIQTLRSKAYTGISQHPPSALPGNSYPLHYSTNTLGSSTGTVQQDGITNSALYGTMDFVANAEMIHQNTVLASPYVPTPSVEGEVLLGQYNDSIRNLVNDINEGNDM